MPPRAVEFAWSSSEARIPRGRGSMRRVRGAPGQPRRWGPPDPPTGLAGRSGQPRSAPRGCGVEGGEPGASRRSPPGSVGRAASLGSTLARARRTRDSTVPAPIGGSDLARARSARRARAWPVPAGLASIARPSPGARSPEAFTRLPMHTPIFASERSTIGWGTADGRGRSPSSRPAGPGRETSPSVFADWNRSSRDLADDPPCSRVTITRVAMARDGPDPRRIAARSRRSAAVCRRARLHPAPMTRFDVGPPSWPGRSSGPRPRSPLPAPALRAPVYLRASRRTTPIAGAVGQARPIQTASGESPGRMRRYLARVCQMSISGRANGADRA